MKKNNIILLVLLLAFASCSFTTNKIDDDPDKDKLLVHVITLALERLHFNPKDVNDDFSKHVFHDYIEQIDPSKRFFTASDIKEFKIYEDKIDDELKNYKVSFFRLTYERLKKRIEESKKIYKTILSKPFDYSIDENYVSDAESLEYVKTKKELKERWRKQLKLNTISSYDNLIEEQETLKEGEAKKSLLELEEAARKETLKSLDIYYTDVLDDLQESDWFSIYINSIVEEYDPHTSYFPPSAKDRFDQSMSGKLEGIGAQLQKRMDHIKIVGLISGGPAWRGQELDVGDFILKVRQDNEKEAVSIVGMRIDDAIKLIKGPKGTKVILTIKKIDGTIKDVSIIRDIVEIEETYAKSSVVKKENTLFGIINLPKFYIDFKDYEKRNAASDIKLEIERLKKQGMQGLVLDLRDNGGGSLQTVVDIAGLFIKEGPVVQVRSSTTAKEVLKDEDDTIIWDGPLVILVNELSASASEILAAAMQDYKRAIIIGSKQTYGKGTVQNVLDLNRMVRSNDTDLGALKLTTQKFYRINGGSTQLEGVKSDVVVPGRYSYIDVGEKDQENPMPWDKIEAVKYNTWNKYFNYDETIAKSKKRMSNHEILKLIDENAKWVKQNLDDNTYSLNYDKYKLELDRKEALSKKFDAISKYKTNLTFQSLPYEQALFKTDTTLQEKRKRWHKTLSKDVYVEEAIHVLEDMKAFYGVNKLADIKK